MKRIVISLCLILGCTMMLAACNLQGPSIGILDEATAFRDNNAAKAAMEYLQAKGAPLQEKAEQAYKVLEGEENEKNANAYREAMGELKTVMGAEQQRIVAMLSEEFNKTIEEYRKSKGLVMVVNKNSVLSFDESVDVTQDIIAEMNKLDLDFAAAVEVSENPAEEQDKAAEE